MTGAVRRVAFAAAVAVACGACTNHSDPTPASSAPTRGADSSFAGDYQGVATMIESQRDAGVDADGGAGAAADTAHVGPWKVSATDDSHDHIVLSIAPNCSVNATVSTRRYDSSGSQPRLPLTLATAAVASNQSCAVDVAGASVAFAIATGDVRLYADGSLEIVIAGGVSGGDGYAELTFEGRRPLTGQ